MEQVKGIIKAMTAYGSDCTEYEAYWTHENFELFLQWLAKQPKVNGVTLFRGYTFDQRYFNDLQLEVGRKVDTDALTQQTAPSFTTDLIRATMYMNEFGEVGVTDTVKVLFVIHTCGKAFVDISSLSYYPEERECKCDDNVALEVVSIQRKAGYLQIEMNEV